MIQNSTSSEETFSAPRQRERLLDHDCLGLTILWHPDQERIGAQAPILIRPDSAFSVSRLTPIFHAAGTNRENISAQSLDHRSVSRQAILLRRDGESEWRMDIPDSRMRVRIDGQIVGARWQFTHQQFQRGTVIELGEQVVLCLGRIPALPDSLADLGLIGVGPSVTRIRAQIRQVARTEMPVLILGESGCGKELIAEALHRLSAQHSHALVRVNMATLTGELAAAELFGAVKGAYTGATQGRRGLFAEANGGTLFMDEIGDTPSTVQPMLLRALESGEYRMLGATRTEHAKVRIIAATDRSLADGSFNIPLLRRLEAFVINVPPLRARQEDIGLLVRHSLRAADVVEPSLFSASDLAELARFDWPGNVRQLFHVVRRLILARRHRTPISVAALLEAFVGSESTARGIQAVAHTERGAKSAEPGLPKRSYRHPSTVADTELRDALANCSWCIREAAAQLGVSRTSFYALLERSQLVRKPRLISEQEITAVISAFPNAPSTWAAELNTPREALQRHLREQRIVAPPTPESDASKQVDERA